MSEKKTNTQVQVDKGRVDEEIKKVFLKEKLGN